MAAYAQTPTRFGEERGTTGSLTTWGVPSGLRKKISTTPVSGVDRRQSQMALARNEKELPESTDGSLGLFAKLLYHALAITIVPPTHDGCRCLLHANQHHQSRKTEYQPFHDVPRYKIAFA